MPRPTIWDNIQDNKISKLSSSSGSTSIITNNFYNESWDMMAAGGFFSVEILQAQSGDAIGTSGFVAGIDSVGNNFIKVGIPASSGAASYIDLNYGLGYDDSHPINIRLINRRNDTFEIETSGGVKFGLDSSDSIFYNPLVLKEELYITGNANIKGDLNVVGKLSMTSSQNTLYKSLILEEDLYVTGNVNIKGNINVIDRFKVVGSGNYGIEIGDSNNASTSVVWCDFHYSDGLGTQAGQDFNIRLINKANDLFQIETTGGAKFGLTSAESIFYNPLTLKSNMNVTGIVQFADDFYVIDRFHVTDKASSSAALTIVQTNNVSTNYGKIFDVNGLTIYDGNGYTPNGLLAGTQGDLCVNSTNGSIFKCQSGTIWYDLENKPSYRTVYSDFTITSADRNGIIDVVTTGGVDITGTIDYSSNFEDGDFIDLKDAASNFSSNGLYLLPSGSESIDNNTGLTLFNTDDSAVLIKKRNDNLGWFIR